MIKTVTGILLIILLVTVAACGTSAPVAEFQASNITGEAPITVQFTDQSEGEIDSWEWDFDSNGEVDSWLRNPQYTFENPCNCNVTLTVNGPGGEDSTTRQFNFVPAPVVANFEADVTKGQGKTTVHFTDLSTGMITAWQWDFYGNGSIDSTEQNPSFIYARNGNHTVSLTVNGPYGQDTMVKENYIHITGCPT